MVITNVQDRNSRPSVASNQLEGSARLSSMRGDVLTTLASILVPNLSVATIAGEELFIYVDFRRFISHVWMGARQHFESQILHLGQA